MIPRAAPHDLPNNPAREDAYQLDKARKEVKELFSGAGFSPEELESLAAEKVKWDKILPKEQMTDSRLEKARPPALVDFFGPDGKPDHAKVEEYFREHYSVNPFETN